jgi:hypothetical protein
VGRSRRARGGFPGRLAFYEAVHAKLLAALEREAGGLQDALAGMESLYEKKLRAEAPARLLRLSFLHVSGRWR